MTRRLRSRPTVAALLLAALLPLGCGARDAPGTASLLAARDAPSADATITTPRGAPPTASALIPAAVQGRWTPVSKALAGAGPLTLTAQTLAWSPCGPVARAVQAETSGSAMLLTLPGQTACRLDADPLTHLRLQPRAGNACEMELSVYESAAQLARQQRLAWGVYTRDGCRAAAPQKP